MARTLVISLFASLALLVSACESMDSVETTYQDFESLTKAGAIGEGKWIPRFLPSSATKIREKHNLDTNEIWLTFHFNVSDQFPAGSTCRPKTSNEITCPRRSPGHWWPAALVQNSDHPPDGAFSFFHCEDGATLAINREKGEAFYWVLAP